MSKQEYEARIEEQHDWAPGWEAIDQAFATLYGDQNPVHLATNFPARAMMGGPEYLDGISAYASPAGHWHVVSYGMSCLYAEPAACGGEFSGWGYELTGKVAISDREGVEDFGWIGTNFYGLARYTYGAGKPFFPHQFVRGDAPLARGIDTAITSYLIVEDTEVSGVDTVHGRLDFLQLVGITTAEVDWLESADSPERSFERARELERRLAEVDPRLCTDLSRSSIV